MNTIKTNAISLDNIPNGFPLRLKIKGIDNLKPPYQGHIYVTVLFILLIDIFNIWLFRII